MRRSVAVIRWLMGCIVMIAIVPEAEAQKVQATLIAGPKSVRAGDTFKLLVKLSMTDGTALDGSAAVKLDLIGSAPGFEFRGDAAPNALPKTVLSDLSITANGVVPGNDTTLTFRVVVDGVQAEGQPISLTVTRPTPSLSIVDVPSELQLGVPLPPFSVAVVAVEHGKPLRSVPVRAVVAGKAFTETTDSDGRAVFTGLTVSNARLDKPATLQVYAQGAAPLNASLTPRAGPPSSVTIDKTTPLVIRVDRPFDVTVRAVDPQGNAATGQVRIEFRALDSQLTRDSGSNGIWAPSLVEPTKDGSATFGRVRARATAGKSLLVASMGGKADSVSVEIVSGPAFTLRALQQPPAQIVADSVILPAPSLVVSDVAGNLLAKIAVSAEVVACSPPKPMATTPDSAKMLKMMLDKLAQGGSGIPNATNTSNAVTDEKGIAEFKDLLFVGKDGCWRIRYLVGTLPPMFSRDMRYDAQRAYNKSFVIISGIKSIQGVSPTDELVDVRFRYRLNSGFHVLVNSDIGLKRTFDKEKKDSLVDVQGSKDLQIGEAAIWLNYTRKDWPVIDSASDIPERYPYAGLNLRVFATVPYVGVHVGSVELVRSKFHGSMANVGFERALSTIPVKVGDVVIRPSKYNLLLEAFVRSDGIDFFKYLSIKGTLMIPTERGRRPITRIAFGIPIGGLITF